MNAKDIAFNHLSTCNLLGAIYSMIFRVSVVKRHHIRYTIKPMWWLLALTHMSVTQGRIHTQAASVRRGTRTIPRARTVRSCCLSSLAYCDRGPLLVTGIPMTIPSVWLILCNIVCICGGITEHVELLYSVLYLFFL